MLLKIITVFNIVLVLAFFSCKQNAEEQKEPMDSLASKEMTDPQIAALTQKIQNDPTNPENYFMRSNLFLQLNNISAAYTDVSKAISLDSTNLEYYFSLADIYLRGGSADRAIDVFNQITGWDGMTGAVANP